MIRKIAPLLIFWVISQNCSAQCAGSSKELASVEVRSKEYPAEPVVCESVAIYCSKKGEVISAAENATVFKVCLSCDDIKYISLKSGNERYYGKDNCKLSDIQNQTVYLSLKPEFIRQRNTFITGINNSPRLK